MSLFDRFRKGAAGKRQQVVDASLRQQLIDLVLNNLRDPGGRVRVEDAICAAATIVGERCIDAAGDYSLRDHDFVPGQRCFSTKANELICGDVSEGGLDQVPKDSIIGVLRSRLDTRTYSDDEFPALSEVFAGFAARTGDGVDWLTVLLSAQRDHWPRFFPLLLGCKTRGRVDAILFPIREDRARCLRIAVESLAEILKMVASEIDHKLALLLALETINGVSKTAPMTAKAGQQAQQGAAEKSR